MERAGGVDFVWVSSSQETIQKELDAGSIVMIFTDDPDYYYFYKSTFEDYVKSLQLVIEGAEQHTQTHTSSSPDFVPFERATDVVEFMKEVVAMAQCDKFYGTKGSSVTDMVRGVAELTRTKQPEVKVLGCFPTGKVPSKEFVLEATKFVKEHCRDIDLSGDVDINGEEQVVLDYLSSDMLQILYLQVTERFEEAGSQLSAKVLGRALEKAKGKECRPLATNFSNYRKVRLQEAKDKQLEKWCTALLKYRLMPYLVKHHPEWSIYDVNDQGNIICKGAAESGIVRKTAVPTGRPGSSTDDVRPSKAPRLGPRNPSP